MRLLIPAFIFSILLIEPVSGALIQWKVVWMFYAYIVFKSFTPLKGFNIRPDSIFFLLPFIVLFVLQYLLTSVPDDSLTGELFNLIWWSLFSFFLANELKEKKDVLKFMRLNAYFVSTGITIFGCIGVIKFIANTSFNLQLFPTLIYENQYFEGSSLNKDYNVFALGLIFGLLALKLRFDNGWLRSRMYFIIVSLILFFGLTTSGSRRGFLFGLVVLGIYLFSSFNIQKTISTQFKNKGRIILFLFLFFLFFANLSLIIKWITENLIEDESLNFRLNTIQAQLAGDNERTKRFELALQLLSKKNIIQILFGDGFNYINVYGRVFNTRFGDNPHNFILATLLYGGIISIFLLSVIVYKSLKLYISNGLFHFWFFTVTFLLLFHLTSSNTLMQTRYGIVLLFIPFFLSNKKY